MRTLTGELDVLQLGRFPRSAATVTVQVEQEADQHGLQNAETDQGEDGHAVIGWRRKLRGSEGGV